MKNFKINFNQQSMNGSEKDQVGTKMGGSCTDVSTRCPRVLSRIVSILLLLTLGVGQMWG